MAWSISEVEHGNRMIHIGAFSAFPLGVDADRLPSAVQKLLNTGTVLLQVKIGVDPDSNLPSLVAVGYGVR